MTYAHHGDACRAANALDLVGDRWTLIVVRELLLGPKRFADLQDAVRGITPAVLSDRLRSLRQAGIVDQVTLPDLARTRAYAVTEWGRGLESVLASLGRWYSSGPDPRTSGGMTPDAMVLAMRTMAPPVPEGLPPTALRLYDARQPNPPVREYRLAANDGLLDVRPGVAVDPVATVTADSTAWSEVLFDGLPLTGAERAGTVRVEGDRDTVTDVVRLYLAAPRG
ncbi:winged helix-turn-helix transcriptional regulator [Micromonospora sediminimaris]|uniref:winged helix-turn-helix transcriptional regulator n=1 Tax=Micromonospora sediminimaris TaxID=547162 RepID=UPI0008EF16CB|nr:helix-turn-helix domain-containing protein [Micromonospora sediminimaris]SFC49751.1 transcriptional regulator, HxlR family [Micromonospora sediminimaris]